MGKILWITVIAAVLVLSSPVFAGGHGKTAADIGVDGTVFGLFFSFGEGDEDGGFRLSTVKIAGQDFDVRKSSSDFASGKDDERTKVPGKRLPILVR